MEDINLIIAGATISLAVLTAALVFFTALLAREAKKTREQEQEPNIVVTIEPAKTAHSLAIMVIENVGKGPAYDVVVTEKTNPTISLKKEYALNDLALMRLPILKPGQKIDHLLSKFEDLPQDKFQFDISAKDANGKKIRCANDADTSFYVDRLLITEKTFHNLVQVLEKIESNFSHILSGFKHMNVNIYDKADREEKDQQWKDQMEELYQLLPKEQNQ